MDTQTTTPQRPADRASAVGDQTKQAAGDVAATANQEAKQVTREAKEQVRQLWSQTRSDLTDQAATQQTRVAGGLRERADQLGQMAGASEQDGMARGLVDDAARRASEAASWLDQRDPGSLLEEARSFARQRPGAFLAIAAGVGVLAGRLSRGLVDEARDSSGPGSTASGASSLGGTTHAGTPGGYGTGSLAATDSNGGGTGMPTATSPTTATTTTTPTTPGASPDALAEGSATVPSGDLPGPHRTSQPLQPDGTPSPIDLEGNLTARADDALRGER
jgi:hypothetical protein